MTKYALLTSILVLAGCVTNPERPPPPPPAATTTPATTAGEITTIETPSSAKRTPNSDDPQDTQTHRAAAQRADDDAVNAETAKINAWIDDACPRLLGHASWSRCVRRERNAVNAGLPSTKGLPADIRAWIDDACPRLLGPASWSRCVRRERNAVNAGLPSTKGLPADIRAWIDDACPRLLGPASWSRCVRRERNAVNAGLPSTKGLTADIRAWIEDACPRLLGPGSWSRCVQRQLQAVGTGLPNTGRSSAETAHTAPANARGENTIRWVESTPPTPGGTMARIDPEPKAPSRPPEDPAPHLPKPKNGERWLCVDAWDGLWPALLSSIEDGEGVPPEPTIVLTRETPRDQAKGTGKIGVAGIIHKTQFEIEGVSRRWDWNFEGRWSTALDTIVIDNDGSGAYYDFRGLGWLETSTRASEHLRCVEG